MSSASSSAFGAHDGDVLAAEAPPRPSPRRRRALLLRRLEQRLLGGAAARLAQRSSSFASSAAPRPPPRRSSRSSLLLLLQLRQVGQAGARAPPRPPRRAAQRYRRRLSTPIPLGEELRSSGARRGVGAARGLARPGSGVIEGRRHLAVGWLTRRRRLCRRLICASAASRGMTRKIAERRRRARRGGAPRRRRFPAGRRRCRDCKSEREVRRAPLSSGRTRRSGRATAAAGRRRGA